MYTQYFGFKFNPFDKNIATDNLYESNDFKELSARLKYLQTTREIGLVFLTLELDAISAVLMINFGIQNNLQGFLVL